MTISVLKERQRCPYIIPLKAFWTYHMYVPRIITFDSIHIFETKGYGNRNHLSSFFLLILVRSVNK